MSNFYLVNQIWDTRDGSGWTVAERTLPFPPISFTAVATKVDAVKCFNEVAAAMYLIADRQKNASSNYLASCNGQQMSISRNGDVPEITFSITEYGDVDNEIAAFAYTPGFGKRKGHLYLIPSGTTVQDFTSSFTNVDGVMKMPELTVALPMVFPKVCGRNTFNLVTKTIVSLNHYEDIERIAKAYNNGEPVDIPEGLVMEDDCLPF